MYTIYKTIIKNVKLNYVQNLHIVFKPNKITKCSQLNQFHSIFGNIDFLHGKSMNMTMLQYLLLENI